MSKQRADCTERALWFPGKAGQQKPPPMRPVIVKNADGYLFPAVWTGAGWFLWPISEVVAWTDSLPETGAKT